MFGISFTELIVIILVALIAVGPQKLPQMLRSVGEWIAKLRSLTTQVRQQTGIDDILRQEGIEGGLSELRGLLRGDLSMVGRSGTVGRSTLRADDPYAEAIEYDQSREYPLEGPDAYGALPDDLVFFDETEAEPSVLPPASTASAANLGSASGSSEAAGEATPEASSIPDSQSAPNSPLASSQLSGASDEAGLSAKPENSAEKNVGAPLTASAQSTEKESGGV